MIKKIEPSVKREHRGAKATGTDEEKQKVFQEVLDAIEAKVKQFSKGKCQKVQKH